MNGRVFLLGGRRQDGFTLIELMIAMLLGLIVIAGVTSVFLAGQQSYRTNQALGEVQDASRLSFEIMARDIRDAGFTGCGDTGRVGNVLKNGPDDAGTDWWANWGNVIVGGLAADAVVPAGTATGQRVTGNDSLMLIGGGDQSSSVTTYDPSASEFTLSDDNAGVATGDPVIICDPDHAVLAQASTYTAASKTLKLAVTGTPGNCTTGLALPTDCSATSNYPFGQNSLVTKLVANVWYIGVNPVQGTSLYRLTLRNTAGVISTESQEIIRDVSGMSIQYHVGGDKTFEAASSVSNWSNVDSVKVTWKVKSATQRAGTDGNPLERSFTATTMLRNRVN